MVCVCLGQEDKSSLGTHSWDLGHEILFSETQIFFRTSSWGNRLVRESLEIWLEHGTLNP